MELPYFLSKEGDSLVFNQDNSTFIFYVPENYFNNTAKISIAEIIGQRVSMIGICSYSIMDAHGKVGKIKPFVFPTMMLCKPYEIEKVKGLNIDNSEPADYVLLKFKKGDEVISETKVPQLIDNVEMIFKMFILTSKIPNTIPCDQLWSILLEAASLNGFSFGVSVQLVGLLLGGLCRDPKNLSRVFSETDMKDKNNYRMISVQKVAKYMSPYTALTSENWDEAVRAAILMKDEKEEDIIDSPLEKIMTM